MDNFVDEFVLRDVAELGVQIKNVTDLAVDIKVGMALFCPSL